MKMNTKERDSLKWSQDCHGVYKQYNHLRSRWEVRVLGRQMSTKPWCSWTRLLRIVKDEAEADARLSFLKENGANLMKIDEHGMLVQA